MFQEVLVAKKEELFDDLVIEFFKEKIPSKNGEKKIIAIISINEYVNLLYYFDRDLNLLSNYVSSTSEFEINQNCGGAFFKRCNFKIAQDLFNKYGFGLSTVGFNGNIKLQEACLRYLDQKNERKEYNFDKLRSDICRLNKDINKQENLQNKNNTPYSNNSGDNDDDDRKQLIDKAEKKAAKKILVRSKKEYRAGLANDKTFNELIRNNRRRDAVIYSINFFS